MTTERDEFENLPPLPDEVRCVLVLLMEEVLDTGNAEPARKIFKKAGITIRRALAKARAETRRNVYREVDRLRCGCMNCVEHSQKRSAALDKEAKDA